MVLNLHMYSRHTIPGGHISALKVAKRRDHMETDLSVIRGVPRLPKAIPESTKATAIDIYWRESSDVLGNWKIDLNGIGALRLPCYDSKGTLSFNEL